MAASILLPGPTLPKLSTNTTWQMALFSKITCHFPGLFFLQKFYWKLQKQGGGRGRSHPIPSHMMTSYDTAAICQVALVETSAWGAYFQGIRSCQNPIGRAVKLKSMALPYKTKVRKKNDQNFDFGVF